MYCQRLPVLISIGLLAMGCRAQTSDSAQPKDVKREAAELISKFEAEIAPLWTTWQTAEWEAHTHVRKNNARFAEDAAAARETYQKAIGNPAWVRSARDVDRESRRKAKILAKRLETEPANEEVADKKNTWSPPTAGEYAAIRAISTLARRHSRSTSDLRSKIDEKHVFLQRYQMSNQPSHDGAERSSSALSLALRSSGDVEARRGMWKSLLAPAGSLKQGYAELRDLRNTAARKSGWDNHLTAINHVYYESVDSIAEILSSGESDLRPLLRELHTWTRHTLAERYGQSVPDNIPVHWLDAPLGSSWASALPLPELQFGAALDERDMADVVADAGAWFVGMGIPALPDGYWQNSSMYPIDEGSKFTKTAGSGTWHLDTREDIRTLTTMQPTEASWHALYREIALAHAMHARVENQDNFAVQRMLPPRGLSTSLANWADFLASKPDRLAELGLIDASAAPDGTMQLLQEALTWVTYQSYATGTMLNFERAVYEKNLAPDRMNAHWWSLAEQHQGVTPPERRTERFGDALVHPALLQAPGQYVDQALAVLVMFHMHVNLCERLGLDPYTSEAATSPEVGDAFARLALAEGTEGWLAVIEEVSGAPLSADAMNRYFAPLNPWLVEANDGRRHTMSKDMEAARPL